MKGTYLQCKGNITSDKHKYLKLFQKSKVKKEYRKQVSDDVVETVDCIQQSAEWWFAGKDRNSYCQASYSPLPKYRLLERVPSILAEKSLFAKFKGCFSMLDAVQGNSFIWNQLYSLPYTKVLGFVACHSIYKQLVVGAAEMSWSNVQQIKDRKRSNLCRVWLEKRSILYLSAKLNEAWIRADHSEDGEIDVVKDYDIKWIFFFLFAKLFWICFQHFS